MEVEKEQSRGLGDWSCWCLSVLVQVEGSRPSDGEVFV